MAAVLNDHNLQYLLLCSPDPTITTRLAYWLDHVLYQGCTNVLYHRHGFSLVVNKQKFNLERTKLMIFFLFAK